MNTLLRKEEGIQKENRIVYSEDSTGTIGSWYGIEDGVDLTETYNIQYLGDTMRWINYDTMESGIVIGDTQPYDTVGTIKTLGEVVIGEWTDIDRYKIGEGYIIDGIPVTNSGTLELSETYTHSFTEEEMEGVLGIGIINVHPGRYKNSYDMIPKRKDGVANSSFTFGFQENFFELRDASGWVKIKSDTLFRANYETGEVDTITTTDYGLEWKILVEEYSQEHIWSHIPAKKEWQEEYGTWRMLDCGLGVAEGGYGISNKEGYVQVRDNSGYIRFKTDTVFIANYAAETVDTILIDYPKMKIEVN